MVAAYCRVSTDHDEQEDSLENQIRHYRDEIKANPEYEFVNVYYDFGISGYKEARPGFQKMMGDARDGRIDLILAKSISRFARNTQTVLGATRELKDLGVAVYFELQDINTLTSAGELMMTVYAAFAQAESQSTRELCRLVYLRKYEAGIPVQYLERSFGYKKNEKGGFVPDEAEAEWVRTAYRMIADGHTAASVKRYLNGKGVKTAQGVSWTESKVIQMIENVIYKGDYIMHKHFVNEDRKLVPNRGEVDAWYAEDDHVPLVSKSLWQRAQDALASRRGYLAEGSVIGGEYPYKDFLFCAECGHPLYARIYSNGNRLNWGCSGQKRYGKAFCRGVNVPDGTARSWDLSAKAYVYEKTAERGFREYGFYSEGYWKRTHKKKERALTVPELNTDSYPYMRQIFCARCGGRLVRRFDTKTEKVFWVCNTNKRNGKSSCPGVRIPDAEVRNWNFDGDIFISERRKNGEKRYSYSSERADGGPQGSAESK